MEEEDVTHIIANELFNVQNALSELMMSVEDENDAEVFLQAQRLNQVERRKLFWRLQVVDRHLSTFANLFNEEEGYVSSTMHYHDDFEISIPDDTGNCAVNNLTSPPFNTDDTDCILIDNSMKEVLGQNMNIKPLDLNDDTRIRRELEIIDDDKLDAVDMNDQYDDILRDYDTLSPTSDFVSWLRNLKNLWKEFRKLKSNYLTQASLSSSNPADNSIELIAKNSQGQGQLNSVAMPSMLHSTNSCRGNDNSTETVFSSFTATSSALNSSVEGSKLQISGFLKINSVLPRIHPDNVYMSIFTLGENSIQNPSYCYDNNPMPGWRKEIVVRMGGKTKGDRNNVFATG